MRVYIKGMEMPTDGCKGCIFVNRKWLGDICLFLKRDVSGNVERGGFQTDCPLIPVPPHGRLIDADALTNNKLLRTYIRFHTGVTPPSEWMILGQHIINAPTIIPAEEGE